MADFGDTIVELPERQGGGPMSANSGAQIIVSAVQKNPTQGMVRDVWTSGDDSPAQSPPDPSSMENGHAPVVHDAPEPRPRRHNTKLARRLKERHVNMIAFSAVVGVGFYLQNGRVIYLAGPGMTFLIYPIGVAIVWAAMGSLGEMTALYPVPGALFELPARFLDQSIGYAAGWMAWFCWVVINAAELDAVAGLFNFSFDKEYLKERDYPRETLQWPTVRYNPGIWVASFWCLSLLINLLPIRIYGEIEYVIGVFKMFFFVGLIIFQLVLNIVAGFGDSYYQRPYSFVATSFTTVDEKRYTSPGWRAGGVWSGFVVTIYSLIGFEAVSITAAENEEFDARHPTFVRREGIKISTRKIAIRILTLYTFSTFLVGFNVPSDDHYIGNPSIQALGGGQNSPFIVAAVRARQTFWPGFMNGVFVLSAASASINSLYLASRLLHALALAHPAWPDYRLVQKVRWWLQEVSGPGILEGVPRNAVFVSSLFGWLGFLACSHGPATDLGRLAINSSVSMLIVYAIVCWTYVRFKKTISQAARGSSEPFLPENDINDPPNPVAFDRNAWTYPYRSSKQSGRAVIAAWACIVIVMFNGWRTIYPFAKQDFVASYISIVVFGVLVILYRIRFTGWKKALKWSTGLQPSVDIRNPIMVQRSPEAPGRDHLNLDTKDFWSVKNLKEFGRWIKAWML